MVMENKQGAFKLFGDIESKSLSKEEAIKMLSNIAVDEYIEIKDRLTALRLILITTEGSAEDLASVEANEIYNALIKKVI